MLSGFQCTVRNAKGAAMKLVFLCVAGLLPLLAGAAGAQTEGSDETPAAILIRIGSEAPPWDAVQVAGDPFDVLAETERHNAFESVGFIHPDRAVSLARQHGLKPGVEPWRAQLLFDPDLGQPVWRVTNTLRAEPGRTEGRAVTLHAVTGANLGTSDWWARIE